MPNCQVEDCGKPATHKMECVNNDTGEVVESETVWLCTKHLSLVMADDSIRSKTSNSEETLREIRHG